MILVAIPVGPNITASLLDRAVSAALAQTADCIVLAVGDGCKPPVTVRDDRLVVASFRLNRGAPFTQQAMLLASPFRWYAPHGADDWADPGHLAANRAAGPNAGAGCIWVHRGRRATLRTSPHWVEFGVFETDALRAIGGYNAAEPCGQDSVLYGILGRTTGIVRTETPTYHKTWRRDSLTHAASTGRGSALREAVKDRNRAVLARCEEIGWARPAEIGAWRESTLPARVRRALDVRTRTLRSLVAA